MSLLHRSLFLSALLALTACEGDPRPLEYADSDLYPEQTLSGDVVRDQWQLSDGLYVSDILEAPTGATRVGTLLELPADAPLLVEARGFDEDGVAGPWLPLETTWHDEGQRVARVDFEDFVYAAQLRIDAGELRSVVWSAVVPAEESQEPVATIDGEVGSVSSGLRSDLAALGVVSRSEWGARSGRGCSSNTSKNRMAIHHTVTPSDSNPGVRIRGIQAYHMDSNGWCDIGYHFLVTVDGGMYEGRPLGQLGTHVLNNNTGNIGISYIGCFHSSGCNGWGPATPPSAMLDAGATLVREMSRIYGITINASNVKGHRDHSGQSTSCPGDHLHALLPEIRNRASGPSGPVWSAAYVEQSFPLARDPFVIPPGETRSGYLEMRNTGTDPWRPGETFLGTTEPRDGDSPLAAPDWVSGHRAATIDRVVEPGETGRFEFSVRAPNTAGDYPQYFNLVQEDVAWFSSPGDDQLQIRVTVESDLPEPMDAGTPDAGVMDAGSMDAGVAMDAGVGGGVDDAGMDAPGESPVVTSGCAVAPSTSSDGRAWLVLAPLALLLRRRRR